MITFNGREIPAEPGQTVAAALIAAGIRSWRDTRRTGEPRGIFCGIGACYDCLVTINNGAPQRACVAPVTNGDTIEPIDSSHRDERL
jgi:NADH dehydrogenase/NADH:ubiquinone oxidoreductase subunit G